MRWLKHLSTAHNDERLREIWTQYGLEGYGFWWVLCEIIAENMDESEKCEVSYPMRTWASKFQLSKRKTTALLQVFADISLILMEKEESNSVKKVKIKIPNLLKYRDEYSKKLRTNSGATPDKLRSKIEIERQKQIEIEKKKESLVGKPTPPRDLFDLWNKIIESPKASTFNTTRETKCRIRLNERSIEEWEKVFNKIRDSHFCQGQNQNNWRADFDWIIANDSNAVKVIDGRYDNRTGKEQLMENPFEKLRRGGYET